jgi:hypothetical protein
MNVAGYAHHETIIFLPIMPIMPGLRTRTTRSSKKVDKERLEYCLETVTIYITDSTRCDATNSVCVTERSLLAYTLFKV